MFIPQKTVRPKSHQPWITPELRKLMNKRDRAYKKMKKSGRQEDKDVARNLRRKAQQQLRRNYWSYLNDTFEEEEQRPQATKNKKFWSFIKHQRTTNNGVAPLKKDGRLYSDPKTQAEILNQQFQSVFSEGKEYSSEEFQQKTGMNGTKYPPMDEIDITTDGVLKVLRSLDPNKASGPDGIGPRVLREIAEEVAPSLTILFQTSMSSGVVPADWRDAYVTPIFKKGEQYNPANYRPVSLTCVICKVMEHVVSSAMMGYLDSRRILTDRQHGFRKGRSCETQLLEFVDEIVGHMEGGGQVDILIMDLTKAFDKVNHSLLLHKLHRYGVQGHTNRWIASFLQNRQQAVVVNGSCSEFVPVRSGVPQGSVLGPFLFLAYINDLPDNLTTNSRLFADDTAVYNRVCSTHDQDVLQQDLHRLADWEMSWDMQFHPAKCNTLPVTRKRRPLQFNYQLHDHHLEVVDSAKYLGVTLQNKMDWEDHINSIWTKANQVLGFLRRNLKISSPSIKAKAYKTFVRPLLEYSASVWDPYEKQHKVKLENIQRRAARFVLNRYQRSDSVTTMLEILGWKPLEDRRKKARLLMFYKIKNNLVNCPRLKEQLQSPRKRAQRCHDQQMTQIATSTDYRLMSFLPRTIVDWNSLPQDTVDAKTPDTFVSRPPQTAARKPLLFIFNRRRPLALAPAEWQLSVTC
ncbi:hypothetical protein ACOMHN_026460 [Nucella lapillus]